MLNTVTLDAGALGPGRIVLLPSQLLAGHFVAVVEVYRAVMIGDTRDGRHDGRWVWVPVFVSERLGLMPARDAALAWWKGRG